MFARRFLATFASTAYGRLCGDLIVVLMIGVTGIVMVASVVVVAVIVMTRAGIFELCDMLKFPVLMRLARASMMETAPENRVQQHRCNGEKFKRGGHAESS